MARSFGTWLRSFEDFKAVKPEFIEAGGDEVLVLNIFEGRGRTSGVPVDGMPGAVRFVIRDGSVVRLAIYLDIDLAKRDAGVEG